MSWTDRGIRTDPLKYVDGCLTAQGKCTNETASATSIIIPDLAGYGDDFFNNHYYLQVIKNADSAGNSPEHKVRKITDYVSATGTFTCDTFTQTVAAGDECIILHESLVVIGRDDADNVFSSSNVVSNEDGSVLERLEWIQATLGGAAIQLRTEQSKSTTVEEGGIMQFSVGLIDIDTGAIAAGDIDITTAIVQSMEQSRGGGAFAPIIDPVVSFSKDTGRVYMDYTFKTAQWNVGDVYKMSLSGVTCTVGGDKAYVPAMVWSNMVMEAANIDTNVETILSELAGSAGVATFPSAANIGDGVSIAEAIRAILTSMVGGDDYDAYTNISNSANASLDAIAQKFANTVGIDGTNTFSTAIHGEAQTTIEAALSTIATYVVAAGADFSKKVNNLTLRTNLEDIIQDICAVIGCDAANVWGTTVNGASQTTIEATEQAIGTAVQNLSALTDGSTASLDTVVDKSIICKLATKDAAGGDSSDFDNTTDSLEALSDKLGAFTGDGGTDQGDSAKANTDIIITDTEKIYDVALGVAPVAGSLASFIATGGTGLGTSLPASTSIYDTTKNVNAVGVTSAPVANTLADTLHKNGSFTYDNTTDSLEAIADSLGSATGVFHEQANTPISYNTDDSEDIVLSLATADTRYILRSLYLKFADPGANIITVRLKLLINDVSTTVKSYTVTTDNYADYLSLMDMFGEPQICGDSIIISTQNSAAAVVAVTGQYSYAKNTT